LYRVVRAEAKKSSYDEEKVTLYSAYLAYRFVERLEPKLRGNTDQRVAETDAK
jgi:hypothetical protein